MSMLRTTGTFPVSGTETSETTDLSAATASQAHTQKDRAQVWPSDDTAAKQRPAATRDLTVGGAERSDIPLTAHVPAHQGNAALMRPGARIAQSTPLLVPSERSASASAAIHKQELAARAQELFTGLLVEVEQWVSQLVKHSTKGAFKTSSNDYGAVRMSLRHHIAELNEVANAADAGRRGPSCLSPEQHRQVFHFLDSLNAFERRLGSNGSQQSVLYTAENALLYQLRKALSIKEKKLSKRTPL